MRPKFPPPASMASLPALKLNAAVKELEDLKAEFREYKAKARDTVKFLRLQNAELREKQEDADDKIEWLAQSMGLEEALSGERDTEQEREEDEQEDGQVGGGVSEEDAGDAEGEGTGVSAARVQKSKEWKDSKVIKDAVNTCMKIRLGVKNLVPKELPSYPAGFDRTSAAWPEDDTGAKLTRLDCKQKIEHERNQVAYQEILQHVKHNGSALCPAAAQGLREILEGDLASRVEQRMKYILKTAAAAARDAQTSVRAQTADRDGDDDEAEQGDGEGEQRENALKRSKKNARVQSKLEQRERKRVGSAYTDAKYNSAFTLTAMSDDDDDPEPEDGRAKRYISHAPDYRSNEVQSLYDEIDLCRDPNPDKAKLMTDRVRGNARVDSEPPKAKKLAMKIRVWQVAAERSEANPHWLTTGRIASNGVLWGDAEDPVDVDEEKGKVAVAAAKKRLVAIGRGRKRQRRDEGTTTSAKMRTAEFLEGRDEAALFEL